MKIQHNIPAMNAYRNYTNNVSAVAKNLEKLSSGYRINRAGDDAAGLAISEKMRAQITGLETAQKNAKDGISLIQTAEGALTEVHSMLNRMFELAEQSANGTYDNEVDRANLQKEFDALRSEIDRIADSSNFNGQKLLDGSLAIKEATSVTTDYSAGGAGSITLPPVGTELGVDTLLNITAGTATGKTGFSVEFHSASVAAAIGDTVEFTLGEGDSAVTYSFTATANGTLTTENLVNGFMTATGGKVFLNGQEFTLTKTDADTIGFEQTNTPTSQSEIVDGSMQFKIGVKAGDGAAASTGAAATTVTTSPTSSTAIDWATGFDADALSKLAAAAKNAGASTSTITAKATDNILSLFAGDKLIATADLTAIAGEADTVVALTFNDVNDSSNSFDLTVAGESGESHAALADLQTAFKNPVNTAIKFTAAGDSVGGTYNVGTTDVVNGSIAGSNQLASTIFDLTEQMVRDGATLKLGNQTYTFAVGADSKVDNTTANYIDLTDMELGDADLLAAAAQKITEAAKTTPNDMFTIGNPGNGATISLHEKAGQAVGNLKTMEQFQSFVQCNYSYSETVDTAANRGLMLQIGDTADSYNMLEVSVDDMHTAALGIDATKINISQQGDSQKAMDAIKNAINSVSSTRGDLGALQNRLEHTINNLGVMQENIQDAEASIRDTDIAKEMMAYTKNNILVQASQAMLAQANQLPQGVLQLLG